MRVQLPLESLDEPPVVSVHGDDFTCVGRTRDLDWYEEKMEGHYELTKQPRLGPGVEDANEAVILNRITRWTPDGAGV